MGPLQRLSLRQKLPLFLIGLTATALAVAGLVAWGDVRASARAAGEASLRGTTIELANLSQQGQVTRAALERSVGAEPAIQAALAGRVDSAGVNAALRRLATNADGPLPIELWSADRRKIAAVGIASGPGLDSLPPLEEERAWGEFQHAADRTVYWNTAPVVTDGAIQGWIAQMRRLGNAQTADQLGRLIGSGLTIVIGHGTFGTWVDLAGASVPAPPADYPLDSSFPMALADGSPSLAVATQLQGSPWVILTQMPLAILDARPRVFISRMIVVGLLLIGATGLVGWIVSGRLTAPLEDLSAAAAEIASGDYGRRVQAEGGDELARLAAAFNSMAEQLSHSDEALRHRLDEARALALRLEDANVAAESAREEAQAANRAKSDFLATMSHEIRTPINAMIGYTDLMSQGIPDAPTPAQKGYLERIGRSSRLLISLVNDLLDFARIESGQMKVRPGIGEAREAIHEVCSALEPQAGQKGVALTSSCDDEAFFQGDAGRVQQILLNLVSNAVKFTASGGEVRVACATERRGPSGELADGSWVRVDVEDTGIGIAPEQVARIFEAFVQAETGFTREHGGVGLGLAISRRLASLLGGEITVTSERGKGSTFTLWLRAAAVPARTATTV